MSVSAPPASLPTHFYVPEGSRFTIADEIADLMEAVGYQVDEPERMACRALFPQRADGNWAGLDSCIVAPRQNLKTATMIAGALHDTFVRGVERVIWTAHEFKTSTDAFQDFQAIIEGHDWLAAEVLAVRTSNGKEGFDLRNGSRLDVMARTGKSGRGMGTPSLYLDEGLYLQGKMLGAIVPTVSARKNPHIVVGSSPGLQMSGPLREMRTRGRSGSDPYLGWIEWSQEQQPCADEKCVHQPGTPGCWLDDEDAVARVNPALGRRITMEYVRQERLLLADAPVEYLRERMGVWEDPPEGGVSAVYPLEEWAAARDEMSAVGSAGFMAFGIDVSWDRSTAYVAVAGQRDDELVHVQLIHTCNPTDLVDYLVDRCRRFSPVGVALQSNGAPVSSMLDELKKALEDTGVPVVEMGGQDVARAYGVTFDAIKSGRIRHTGQPGLDYPLRQAVTRFVVDGFALDRKKSPVDIAGLVAATNAVYLLSISENNSDPSVWFL